MAHWVQLFVLFLLLIYLVLQIYLVRQIQLLASAIATCDDTMMRFIFQVAFLHLQLQGFSTFTSPRIWACDTRPSLLVGGAWNETSIYPPNLIATYSPNFNISQVFWPGREGFVYAKSMHIVIMIAGDDNDSPFFVGCMLEHSTLHARGGAVWREGH